MSLRTRAHVVRQQTATVLSLHNIIVRNTGVRLSAKRMHAVPLEALERLLPEPDQVLAVTSRLAVVHCLGQQSKTLEKAVRQPRQHTPTSEQLLTVDGIGTIVAQTSVLATGALRRLATVGHDTS
jgi:transposase